MTSRPLMVHGPTVAGMELESSTGRVAGGIEDILWVLLFRFG